MASLSWRWDQYRTLAAITNTAAVASHIHKTIFLFFRLPAGVRSVEGGVAAGVDIISSDGYVALPSGSITDGCRWVKRYAIATAPQWLVDKLAALAASQSQTEGNEVMGAGATAVELFRKGQLPGTGRLRSSRMSRSLARARCPLCSARRTLATKKTKKTRLKSHSRQRRRNLRPQPTRSRSNLPWRSVRRERMLRQQTPLDMTRLLIGFCQTTSPEVTDANVREVLPKIAAELCRRFDVSLTETVELTRIVAEDCDKPPTPAEIEQIVKLAYSPDRASASGVTAKPYSSKLEAALDHARRGFRVLPLIPNGKELVIKEWQYAATSDKERICRWFKENPDYNIAIVMGSGLAAADVDGRKGGSETFQALSQAENLSEHATLTAVTASGGLHLIYRLPEDVRLEKGADRFGQGIDLQTGSAYLVAPGSTIKGNPKYPHCDGEYQWLDDRPIAPMPDGLIEIALKAGEPGKKSKAAGKRLVDEDEDTVRLSCEYLKRRAPEATEGNRNNTAVIVANEFYDYCATEATALGFTWRWNIEKCSSPLDLAEIQTIVASALRSRNMPLGWNHPNNNSGFDPVEIAARFVSLATPFSFPDPATIAPPDWLLEGFALRGRVTTLTGPGGVSKSTWSLLAAVAYTAGREDMCGFRIPKPGRAWVWNQEDPIDVMDARLLAILQEYNVSREDLLDEDGKTRLFRNSGLGRGKRLTLVERMGEFLRPTKDLDRVIKTALYEGADLIVLDPLISVHQAEENSNEEMRAVFDHLADIAQDANCAIVALCHPGKPDKKSSEGLAGDAYAARGASAQPDAARVAATLTGMSEADSKKWRIPGGSLSNYVRLEVPKINDAAIPPTRWYQRQQILVPGYRGSRLPVLKPIDLEPTAMVAEDMAAKIAEAIRDRHGLETWVSIADLVCPATWLPSSLAKTARATSIESSTSSLRWRWRELES